MKSLARLGFGVALIGLIAASVGGCTYYGPHSVVASDRPIRATGTTIGPRMEVKTCAEFFLWIPFGQENSVRAAISELESQTPSAIAFEGLRIDETFTNYIFPIYWSRCVIASGIPVYWTRPALRKRPAAKVPEEGDVTPPEKAEDSPTPAPAPPSADTP